MHVPVIPTVASPKNIMGSRPYNDLESEEVALEVGWSTMMDVVKSIVCAEKYTIAP